MTDDMRERVARAMFEAPDSYSDHVSVWPPSHPDDLAFWLSRADAALAALPQPQTVTTVEAMQYLADGSNADEVKAWLIDQHFAYDLECWPPDRAITGFTGAVKYQNPFEIPRGAWVVIPERRRGTDITVLTPAPTVTAEQVKAATKALVKHVDEGWGGDSGYLDTTTARKWAKVAFRAAGLVTS